MVVTTPKTPKFPQWPTCSTTCPRFRNPRNPTTTLPQNPTHAPQQPTSKNRPSPCTSLVKRLATSRIHSLTSIIFAPFNPSTVVAMVIPTNFNYFNYNTLTDSIVIANPRKNPLSPDGTVISPTIKLLRVQVVRFNILKRHHPQTHIGQTVFHLLTLMTTLRINVL